MSNQSWGHEEWVVVATVDPDANTATAYDTDEINMANFDELMAIVMAGALGTNATLDFAFHAATAEGGSYGAVTGKSITQLTDAGTDSDKQATLVLRGEDLDAGDQWVKGVFTVGTATSDCAVVVLGRAKKRPATDWQLASVEENAV